MTTDINGVLLTALGLAVVAIIGMVGNIVVKRMRPGLTQPEIWKRVDDLTNVIYGDGKDDPGVLHRMTVAETRAAQEAQTNAALGRIIRDLAGQWAGPRPRLNPYDLAELDEKYIPATHPWRQKPLTDSPRKGTADE